MTTIKFTGALNLVTDVQAMPGTKRKYQRIRFQVNPTPDNLGRITEKVNYYDCFIYGTDEISAIWQNYRDDLPAPPATVICQLVGRLRLDQNTGLFYNNLTLRLLKLTWNYDNDQARPTR
jgi:hypothetical protein